MQKYKKLLNILCCSIILGLSTSCFADMTLDSSSSKLSLFSTKQEPDKKKQAMPKLSGSLSSTGDLKVILDLKNIETKIPLPKKYKGLLEMGAGFPSIAGVSMPVSFVLVFNEDKEEPVTHFPSKQEVLTK